MIVQGLARTWLIFTRIQEGAQPGGLTPRGHTEQGIPYHVPIVMRGSDGGERGGGNSLTAREHASAVVESGSVMRSVLFRVFPLSVSSFLFSLFAVLLNCPYPDPPVFCLFLSILLCIPAGGGVATWRFCCRPQPNHNSDILGTKVHGFIIEHHLIIIAISLTQSCFVKLCNVLTCILF